MSCSVQYPLFLSDLSQSQYLSPIPSTSFDELAADIQVWDDYKHQIEAKLAYSDAFRKQFLLFAEQFLYDIKRSQAHNTLDPSSDAFRGLLGAIGLDNDAATADVIPMGGETTPFIGENIASKRTRGRPRSNSFKIRRSRPLVAPRPRVSSPLSPHPYGTPIPSFEQRRPMPTKGRQKAQPQLLKIVLERKAAQYFHGDNEEAKLIGKGTTAGRKTEYRRLNQTYDGLGASWIVVPDDDWEFVTEDSRGADTVDVCS